MGSRERSSYCLVCDRVIVWTNWRTWQKHVQSAEHRECVTAPRPLPPERLRPADTDDRNLGLEVGESVVFRRPDGLWIGLLALEDGMTLRIEASQRQIALERLAKHLPRKAPPTKQLCLRCRLLLDPIMLGYHNTSRLHRSNAEPEVEDGLPPTMPATTPAPEPDASLTDGRAVLMSIEPITLTMADAARVLGLSRSTISTLAAEGTIPTLRIGRRVLVPVDALREWVEGRLREDADRYSSSWARVRDYARHGAAPQPSRGRRRGPNARSWG